MAAGENAVEGQNDPPEYESLAGKSEFAAEATEIAVVAEVGTAAVGFACVAAPAETVVWSVGISAGAVVVAFGSFQFL